MARPVTLFTGQWADLPLEELCQKAVTFGYDGLELACWGDHFEVGKALADDTYCSRKRDLLEKYDLQRTVKQIVARSCSEAAPAELRERVMMRMRQVQVEITER